MSLDSASYFVFLAAVWFVYWPCARSRRGRLAALLFANYFFYARWGLAYLFLIPAASSCDFLIGLGLRRFENRAARRMLVTLSVVLNVGILWHFKRHPAALSLSFYAFQALTYTIDLYRRDEPGTPSYLAHLTAVSFFPTVVAGPITRVCDLVRQLERQPEPPPEAESGRALFLIGLGLVKKLLIADCLADNLVNRVFDLPRLYTGLEALIGVYGYALQLYYDFSGYTDIAIGSALLLGLKLPPNFNRPYAAASITDFWRRWHISFSNWLRDYLYFSLPGLRSRRKILAYGNLVVTMLLGGLWHGLSWNFAIWGLLHGLALAAARRWQRFSGVFLTTQFVCFTWIFFRARSPDTALAILERIGSLTFSVENVSPLVAGVMILAAAGHYLPKTWSRRAQDRFAAAPFYAQAAALAAVVITIATYAGTGAAPFVYSRF